MFDNIDTFSGSSVILLISEVINIVPGLVDGLVWNSEYRWLNFKTIHAISESFCIQHNVVKP